MDHRTSSGHGIGTARHARTDCANVFGRSLVDAGENRKMWKIDIYEIQKTDSEEGRQWSPEAEIKTGDSSEDMLKPTLPDFRVVVKNPLGLEFEVGF